MRVSAVVLAGGRSSRFGRDKLAAPIDGEPMLWRTIAATRAVASDIVVVCAPGVAPELPDDVRVTHDSVADEGPLAGVVAGLAAARHGSVVIVGGDMPWLQADVLGLMLGSLGAFRDVVALGVGGRGQQLPLVVRRDAVLEVAHRLMRDGERRLGSLLDASSAVVIDEPDWRDLDPDAATIRDIDTPGDLPGPG